MIQRLRALRAFVFQTPPPPQGQRTEPDDLEDNSDFARGEDNEEKKED